MIIFGMGEVRGGTRRGNEATDERRSLTMTAISSWPTDAEGRHHLEGVVPRRQPRGGAAEPLSTGARSWATSLGGLHLILELATRAAKLGQAHLQSAIRQIIDLYLLHEGVTDRAEVGIRAGRPSAARDDHVLAE